MQIYLHQNMQPGKIMPSTTLSLEHVEIAEGLLLDYLISSHQHEPLSRHSALEELVILARGFTF